jgi:hypothetical protein
MSSKIEKKEIARSFCVCYILKYTTFLALLFEICIIFEEERRFSETDVGQNINKTVRKKNVYKKI